MHRFGGLNDGQWKEARVPLSWDMVLRDFDSGKVKLGIRSSEELAISDIAIGPTHAGNREEMQYNAETREWVRRAQADLKPAAATAVAAEPAGLSGGAGDRAVRPPVCPRGIAAGCPAGGGGGGSHPRADDPERIRAGHVRGVRAEAEAHQRDV